MGYLAVWTVLEEMIKELRQRGLEIPPKVMNDLKSAYTTIKIGEVDTSAGNTAPKIEEYLGSVESYLITEAQKKFEEKYVDEWLKRLNEAGYETCETCEDEDLEPRFVSGVPRDQKWLRVEPKDELTFERLAKFAEETGLSKRAEEDGHLLVYGKSEALKEFINKMTTFEGSRKDRPPLSG
jgi:hypothetical protein